jgi:hypothetical protein
MEKLLLSYKICVAELDPRLQELDKIRSFKGRLDFCKKNFKYIGAGSSRVVFEYTSDSVIKLAKNSKGLAQNSVEADPALQNYDCVPSLIVNNEKDVWLVVEKMDKAKESDFQSVLGISFEDFCKYMKYTNSRRSPGKIDVIDNDLKEKCNENEFIQELVGIMANFDMKVGDFCRISSYGKKSGKLKLIDAGLTRNVYEEHYS